jgi:aminopeptidase N
VRSRTIIICWVFLWSAACFAQRLPEGVVPIHYTLAFSPDLVSAHFEGHEEIQIRLLKPMQAITLNAAEIEFHSAIAHSSDGTQSATVALDPVHQTATLQLSHPIAGGEAVLEIAFSGILNNELRGFYLTHGKNRDYASTQFESTDARRAFPSFDEPALKATFDISLTVDSGDTAVSNGPIISDTPGPGRGKHTLRFATSPKMSTYLVAMAVGDWKCLEGGADGVPIRICATPDKIMFGVFALAASEHIVHYFNRYYGITYPYKKLDIVAIPDFDEGAMENTAAITFREIYLLVDEKQSSVGARKLVAQILAHEIAHMWFGDLVTMKWWDDVWLNEGFATWITSKPLAPWKPEWKLLLEDVQATSGTLDVDSSGATRQIRAQANTPDEINELFDGIAYGKAAAILHMVENYVGPEVFRTGVNQYLQKYAYDNARAEDFWNTLAQVSNKPVAQIMSSFVDQPGAPMISVRARCSGERMTVTVAQQRFYRQESLMESQSGQVWSIPVCFRAGAGKDCRIVDRQQQEFQFDHCTPELSANADGSGYYRTQYDSEMFGHLPGPDWSPGERDRLAGDAWALVEAGKLSAGEYLELIERMGADRERVVLETEIQPLPTIASDLIKPADADRFAGFVRHMIGADVKQLGWVPAPGESDEDRELRPQLIDLIGGLGKDPDVLQQAQTLAGKYLDNRSSLDGSLIRVVLGLAAQKGGAALYERYADAVRAAKSPEQYLNFLFGLESFSEPELVERTLKMAVSAEVRSQDATGIITGLINRPATRKQAWAWTKEHWSEVHSRFTIGSGSRLVAATGAFCDAADRTDVQGFFADHPVESSERALAKALRNIDACAELRLQQGPQLAAWLEHYSPTKRKDQSGRGAHSTGSSPSANGISKRTLRLKNWRQ